MFIYHVISRMTTTKKKQKQSVQRDTLKNTMDRSKLSSKKKVQITHRKAGKENWEMKNRTNRE